MLAEAVAKKLGYRCIDRDHLVRKAAAWGVSEDDLRTAMGKPPTLLGQSHHKKYLYLAFIQAALTEETRTGNVIYHGLAGHLLLGKGSHILRIRLIAPMEFRISSVQDRLQYDRHQAIDYIKKMDNDRRKWTWSLYGSDWTDTGLYDMVINLEQISVEDACEIVCSTSRLKFFASSIETQTYLEDLATASRVKAHLAMDPTTCDQEFQVLAQGGSVTIKGEIASWHQVKHVARIARAVPGVIEAHMDQLAVVAQI